jgi:glutathione S-transferase
MNCRRRIPTRDVGAEVEGEIERVREIWRDCRKAFPGVGPFLFGAFTIADAMYAPVVLRFETYDIRVGPLEREYMDAVLALPAMRRWVDDSRGERDVIEAFERG